MHYSQGGETRSRGEARRGFTWEDWGPIESSITVRRAVVEGERGEAMVKGPETMASLRTLPVGPELALQTLVCRKCFGASGITWKKSGIRSARK